MTDREKLPEFMKEMSDFEKEYGIDGEDSLVSKMEVITSVYELLDKKLIHFLEQNEYFEIRKTKQYGFIGLQNYAYTVDLCCGLDFSGLAYRYCYPNRLEALAAIQEWDGKDHPPGNWIKRKGLGEDLRREDVNGQDV